MMNRIVLVLLLGLVSVVSRAQNGIGYQAVLRDASGQLLVGENVDLRLSVYGDLAGTQVDYVEEISVVTGSYGQITTEIGTGTFVSGTFPTVQSVDWDTGSKFLNVQFRVPPTLTYTDLGTTPLYAAPFAYHARTTDQTYQLSELEDVDTTGLEIGQALIWNGSSWVPASLDTLSFADTTFYALMADSANYADTGLNIIPSDTALFGWYADTSGFSLTAGQALYADSAGYADTALYALNALNSWDLSGNAVGANDFLGTTNTQPLRIFTDSLERMRITEDGKIGIGISNPTSDLHYVGAEGLLFQGVLGSGSSQSFTGDRLVWYPRKAHFYSGGGTVNLGDGNTGDYSVGIGYNVSCGGDYSMAVGFASQSYGDFSFAGGYDSKTFADYAFSFGFNSSVSGETAIGMGRQAISNGTSSVSLGYHTKAYDAYAVALGYQTEAHDTSSYALGYRSRSLHKGSFVYSDFSSSTFFESTAENQFMVRADGGVRFYSSADLSTGVELAPGSGSWSMLSDSNAKQNIVKIDYEELLNRLDSVPVYLWSYKTQDPAVRHMGPMAQDFYRAFGLGNSDRMISAVDIDGVNLALLKGLKTELDKRNQAYEELLLQYLELERQKERIESLLQELENEEY